MPGPTPAIMAIAFLVVVVVEDILFLISSMGGFLGRGDLGCCCSFLGV